MQKVIAYFAGVSVIAFLAMVFTFPHYSIYAIQRVIQMELSPVGCALVDLAGTHRLIMSTTSNQQDYLFGVWKNSSSSSANGFQIKDLSNDSQYSVREMSSQTREQITKLIESTSRGTSDKVVAIDGRYAFRIARDDGGEWLGIPGLSVEISIMRDVKPHWWKSLIISEHKCVAI